MKARILVMMLGLALLMIAAGCAVTLPHDAPGDEAKFLANPQGFEIVGPAKGTSEAATIFMIPIQPDAGYNAAYQDALESSGADALIDVRSDIKITYFLPPVYEKLTTTVYGTAIRYTR